MKKLLQILISLFVFYLIFQFIINLFIKSHNIKYSIINNEKKYDVLENFNDGAYYFKLTDGFGNKYNFYNELKLNNQKKVIKKIISYKTDDLSCVLPIYINNQNENLLCILNNKQVSYDYLKQINNSSINNIVNKLKKDGYVHDQWNRVVSYKNEDGIYVNHNGIDKNIYFSVWYYKGIYVVDKKSSVKRELLDKDIYENIYSKLASKYYVTFNTDSESNYRYYGIITYNVYDGGKREIEFENGFSKNSYVNGVYKNNYYFTDLDAKKEYQVNLDNFKISEVDGYKVLRNDRLIDISKSEFFSRNQVFDEFIQNGKIDNGDNTLISSYKNNYYYKTSNGEVYQVVDKNYKNPILLFKFDDLKEFKVTDDIISFIVGDTLYMYNNYGLVPVIKRDEFKYNSKNIYAVYKK